MVTPASGDQGGGPAGAVTSPGERGPGPTESILAFAIGVASCTLVCPSRWILLGSPGVAENLFPEDL